MYKKEKKSKKKVARRDKTCYNAHVFPILPTMLTQLEVNKTSTNTGVKIFAFKGELDETNVDTTFPNIISDIGDFAHSRTLFDFRELTYLNSKSIGYIADIAQRTEDGDGKFSLCCLSYISENIPPASCAVFAFFNGPSTCCSAVCVISQYVASNCSRCVAIAISIPVPFFIASHRSGCH